MSWHNLIGVVAIIGNGFDLNLGLKTSYSDFVNSKDFKSLLNKGNYLVDYLDGKHNLQKWIDVENELKLYSASQNILTDCKRCSHGWWRRVRPRR